MHTRTILIASLLLLACGPEKQPTTSPPTTPPPVAKEEKPAAAPIPAGWFAITPQLTVSDVDGAIDFYVKAFGAEKLFSMPGPDGKPMHGEVKIGDSIIMIDVENADMKSPKTLGGSPALLMLYVPDVDAAFATATSAGATVTTPLADQFWGDRFGEVTDPYGHRWALSSHKEDLTEEQMQQRAALAMAPAPAKPPKKKKKPAEPEWKKIAGTPSAQPIPPQYHSVTLALTVAGAAQAIEFYKKAFGATERMRMPDASGKIAHAEVMIGDSIIMLSDEFPEAGAKAPSTLGGSPVTVHHYVADVDAVFGQATAAGAKPAVQPSEMFWGDRWGMLVAPDGYGWGVATHKEDLTPEQINERMKTASHPDATPPS